MAKFKEIKDIARERTYELADNAVSLFRDSVRPIYGSATNGIPQHIGSCIALMISDERYLLTAAHIADWNSITSLYVGGSSLHQLSMDFHITMKPSGNRDKDHYDFAIGKLPKCDIAALDSIQFVTEERIDRGVGYESGRTYTSIGYPNSKNKNVDTRNRTICATLFQYTGVAKEDAKLMRQLKVSHADHILISYNAKHSRDGDGRKVSSVKLEGMSGGAVINLGNLARPPVLAGCENPTPLLAGVLIEVHKHHKAIVATKLDTILKAKDLMFR